MLKQSLLDTWNFFKNHAHTLFFIVLPILIPLQLILALAFPAPEISAEATKLTPDQVAQIFKPFFIALLFAPLYQIAVIYYLESVIKGEPLSRLDCWKLGFKHWAPYLLLSMIVAFIVGSGVMVFVIPGIFFAVRLSFAKFDLLLKGDSLIGAIKSSFVETGPHFWTLLRGYIVILSGLTLPYMLLSSILPNILVNILALLYAVALYIGMTLFSYRVYEMTKADDTPLES
jgi:hypothetical protein